MGLKFMVEGAANHINIWESFLSSRRFKSIYLVYGLELGWTG